MDVHLTASTVVSSSIYSCGMFAFFIQPIWEGLLRLHLFCTKRSIVAVAAKSRPRVQHTGVEDLLKQLLEDRGMPVSLILKIDKLKIKEPIGQRADVAIAVDIDTFKQLTIYMMQTLIVIRTNQPILIHNINSNIYPVCQLKTTHWSKFLLQLMLKCVSVYFS